MKKYSQLNEEIDSRGIDFVSGFIYEILSQRINYDKTQYMNWKQMQFKEIDKNKFLFTVDNHKYEINIKQK